MAIPVSIIIPAFNELAYCTQCVQSILKHTTYPYKLILVDNGSTDGVGKYFDSVPGATVVHTGENKGFSGGVNAGLAHVEGHALLLNSDTVVPPHWLSRLVQPFSRDASIGLVGPRSNCVSGSQEITGLDFEGLEPLIRFSEDLFEEHQHTTRDVARLVGFCMLIRDTVLAEVGVLDEAFGIGNFEDDDYCLRVLRAGYRLCVAEGSFVFHYGSRTFISMGLVDDAWQEIIETNAQCFSRKWDCKPEERNDAFQEARQYNRLALESIEKGLTQAAVQHLHDAIQCAPTYEESFNTLGVVLWEMGEHEKAMENFKRVLRLNHNQLSARENLIEGAEFLKKSEEIWGFLDGLDA